MQAQQVGQLGLGDAKSLARGAEIGHAPRIFAQAYSGQPDYSCANSPIRKTLAMRLRMKNATLAANIAALRRHLGMKQDAFAEKVGASQPSVSKWESRGDMPEARPLGIMADLARVPVADFIDKKWLAPNRTPTPDIPPTRSADGGETASVARLDLSYAMGPGTNLDDSHVEGEAVEFDIAFLRTLTPSPPERLRIVNGVGDSMMPTIHDREELIIDLNQTRLNMQDRIWAISLFGAGALKRLRTIGQKRILVISDNPDVADQEVEADDVVIAGRLVGSIKRH